MTQRHRFIGPAKLIAGLTLLSRILGLVREMVYSHFFGAGPLLSSFRVAFQIPNLARRLFGEGALTSSVVPTFTRCIETEGEGEAQRLAGGVVTLLSSVLLGMLLLGELGLLITSRFVWSPTLEMTAVLLPYMVLICLTAFLAGLLNVLGKFGAPAATPIILNVVIIPTAVVAPVVAEISEQTHMLIVAYSVIVAGVLQLGSQIVWMRISKFRIKINFGWSNRNVRRVLTMMGPMVLGMSAVQINTLADTLIAYFFVADKKGPAVLGYGLYLSNLPLGIFSLALATAIFPLFARAVARKDMVDFAHAIQDGLKSCLFITIPAGIGMMLIATPMVSLLYEHGEFGPDDTVRVVWTLVFYSLGLWAYSMQHMLVRAFYSMEDSKTPVRIAVAMVGLNFVMNLILVQYLREAGVALATAITGTIQMLWLARSLHGKVAELRWGELISTVVRTMVATAVMAAVVLILRGDTPIGRLLPSNVGIEVAVCIVAGAGTFFVAARMLRLQELALFLRRKTTDQK